MSPSRRSFFRMLGLGSAGLSTSLLGDREAFAFQAPAAPSPLLPTPVDDGIRISNNENNRGPGRQTLEAVHSAISSRNGRGYPPDYTNELIDTIAGVYKVKRDNVIVGTGSGPILEGSTRAFCSSEKGLVTAAPTYGTPENMARRMNAPVKAVPVDHDM